MQKLVPITVIASALIGSGFAGTYKLPDQNPIATVTIPAEWKTRPLGEGVEATSKDGQIYLILEAVEGKVAEAIGEEIRWIKNKGVIINADSKKQSQTKLNGMDVISLLWDGKDKQGNAKISTTAVLFTAHQGVLFTYWTSPTGEKKHERELRQILQSIKKA